MCNFYCSFLPHLAHIMRPLMDFLSMSKKEFTVIKRMIITINGLKDAISNATLLVHPVHNAVLSITTDASDMVIAGILHQQH